MSIETLDWLQREEEWKEIEREEFARNLEWKKDCNTSSPEVPVDPVLIDTLTSVVDEYGHMVHCGGTTRAMEIALDRMTTQQRELFMLASDSFGNETTRFSLPTTSSRNFQTNDNGKLSAQIDKMNHIPGISISFMEALRLIDLETDFAQLLERLFVVFGGFWSDYVRGDEFGAATLDQWKEACLQLLDDCMFSFLPSFSSPIFSFLQMTERHFDVVYLVSVRTRLFRGGLQHPKNTSDAMFDLF